MFQTAALQGSKAEQYDAHMANRGVSEHELKLLLPEGKQRSVQNIDYAKHR